MVLILDGNSKQVAHAFRKISLLGEKTQSVTALDLIEYL